MYSTHYHRPLIHTPLAQIGMALAVFRGTAPESCLTLARDTRTGAPVFLTLPACLAGWRVG